MYTAVQVRILKNEYANFFGYSLFEVQTGSMHGTIEAGDWIVVKATKDVKVKDIITYKHGKDFITHRVVEIYKGSYVTKGDANSSKDEPIDRDQVVGRVVKTLHGFGILRKTIFNPIVIVSLIVIFAVVVCCTVIFTANDFIKRCHTNRKLRRITRIRKS